MNRVLGEVNQQKRDVNVQNICTQNQTLVVDGPRDPNLLGGGDGSSRTNKRS